MYDDDNDEHGIDGRGDDNDDDCYTTTTDNHSAYL